MDIIEALNDKFGLIEKSEDQSESSDLSIEKRYFVIILYYYMKDSDMYRIYGTSKKSISSLKEAFEIAKKELSEKKQNTEVGGQFTMEVFEQTWAPIKVSSILSDDQTVMQPIDSRRIDWKEISSLLKMEKKNLN